MVGQTREARTVRHAMSTPCQRCPLRPKRIFKDFSPDTLDFMKSYKIGELTVEAGTPLLSEGSSAPQLYTGPAVQDPGKRRPAGHQLHHAGRFRGPAGGSDGRNAALGRGDDGHGALRL